MSNTPNTDKVALEINEIAYLVKEGTITCHDATYRILSIKELHIAAIDQELDIITYGKEFLNISTSDLLALERLHSKYRKVTNFIKCEKKE
jgi:hypothetical protein